MRFHQWMTCLSTSFILAVNPLYAETGETLEQLQVPQCLAAKLPQSYKVLAENEEFKIIELVATELTRLAQLADAGRRHGGQKRAGRLSALHCRRSHGIARQDHAQPARHP